MLGDDVFFLTGSDEHGIKNQRAAEAAGKTPQEFVDENTEAVKELIKVLNITNDYYIRTTDKKIHWPVAQALWNKLVKSKDIYKKKYKGLYCFGCESFKTEKELVDGKCPIHEKEPEKVVEENYFFRLSKYQDALINIIESDSYEIFPKSRKHEILNFIKNGLEDVSFSRSVKALKWGIPVPDDPDQIMYVWCDALSNYLSGIKYDVEKKKGKYWPADVHIIGKDILRFHSVFWPAMLSSADIPLPRKLFVHGFVTSEGKKMSKSLGNVIDPMEQIDKYGPEPFRYYLLRDIPPCEDGDYSEDRLKDVVNSHLANELGNLYNRVLTLVEKKFESRIPNYDNDEEKWKEKLVQEKVLGIKDDVKDDIINLKFNEALEKIWTAVKSCNSWINQYEIWKADSDVSSARFYNLLESLRCIAIYIYPFMPDTSVRILGRLGLGKEHLEWKNLEWGKLEPGNEVIKGPILFSKVV